MATFNKFQSFVEALAHGEHDLETDQLTVALTNNANAPTSLNSQLSDLTEIDYTNIAENRNLTTASSSQSAGVYSLVLNDLTLTASGGDVPTFRWIVIYNSTTVSNLLIAYFDIGSDITLTDGSSRDLRFPTNLFQLS